MKRMRRIKALEDNSTQMMRSKKPTVEEVVAARVSKIRFQLIGKLFFSLFICCFVPVSDPSRKNQN